MNSLNEDLNTMRYQRPHMLKTVELNEYISLSWTPSEHSPATRLCLISSGQKRLSMLLVLEIDALAAQINKLLKTYGRAALSKSPMLGHSAVQPTFAIRWKAISYIVVIKRDSFHMRKEHSIIEYGTMRS